MQCINQILAPNLLTKPNARALLSNTLRVFIFEPQPWKSYRNARGTTATIDAHFASIALRPSTFIEYLTTEGGFSRVETLGTSTAAEGATFGAGKGAQRGIYALFK